jgi:hypothetical protein
LYPLNCPTAKHLAADRKSSAKGAVELAQIEDQPKDLKRSVQRKLSPLFFETDLTLFAHHWVEKSMTLRDKAREKKQ